MSWFSQTLNSTIGRKVVMSLTGLFLIIFLIGHLSGNFLLLKDDQGEAFNLYADFMNHNGIVQVVRYILYAGILIHIIWAIMLTRHNQKARPQGYAVSHANANSTWTSRNMGILGTFVALFLIIHLRQFWYELKFGDVEMITYSGTTGPVKDLYGVVMAAFSQWWYVALYVFLMVFLALHLAHGFQSAFRTLGLSHKKYIPLVKKVGLAFAIIVPALFASLPVIIFIRSLGS